MAIIDIVIPTYRGMLAESHSSLIAMMQEMTCRCGTHAPWECKKGKHSVRLVPAPLGSSVVHWSRNQAITLALYGMPESPDGRPQAEYIFLMDDDMMCQKGYLSRLVSYKLDIVSGIATVRRDPPRPNIRFWHPDKEAFKDPVEWDWNSNKLMEIDAVGAAFMLVKRRVFEQMGEAYLKCEFERTEDKRKVAGMDLPEICDAHRAIDTYWDRKAERRRNTFNESIAPGGDWKKADCWWFQFLDNAVDSLVGEFGEDLSFCWKAKKLGFRIFADPQVLPGHLGHYAYGIADFREYVEQAKASGQIAKEMQPNKIGIEVR